MAVLGLVALTAAGCAGQARDGADGRHFMAGPVASSAAPSPQVMPSAHGSATRPPDPLATGVPPLKRASKPRLPAAPAPFSGTVGYQDGVKVSVKEVAHGTSGGKGPGVFIGSPRTAVTVEIVNGSTKDLVLNEVVASMTYGAAARVASPVYEDGALDFAGTVNAGERALATYLFAVPAEQRGNVSLSIDLDDIHAAAVFRGSVN